MISSLVIKLTSYGVVDNTFIPQFSLFENNGDKVTIASFSFPDLRCSNETEANDLAKAGALKHIHENYPDGTMYAIQ